MAVSHVLMSEASRHSVSNEAAVVMNELLITDSESFKAADSFTNEASLLLGDAVLLRI